MQSLSDFSLYLQSVSEPEAVESHFNEEYGCPASSDLRDAITKIRYPLSVHCAQAVSLAMENGCTASGVEVQGRDAVKFCSGPCLAAAKSLSHVFSNDNLCTEMEQTRATKLEENFKLCADTSVSAKMCYPGTFTESLNCGLCAFQLTGPGFLSEEIARRECALMDDDVADDCCRKLLKTSSNTTPSSSNKPNSEPNIGMIIGFVIAGY